MAHMLILKHISEQAGRDRSHIRAGFVPQPKPLELHERTSKMWVRSFESCSGVIPTHVTLNAIPSCPESGRFHQDQSRRQNLYAEPGPCNHGSQRVPNLLGSPVCVRL